MLGIDPVMGSSSMSGRRCRHCDRVYKTERPREDNSPLVASSHGWF